MENTIDKAEQDIQQLQSEGSKALLVNIGFFAFLFAGILLVPTMGLQFSAITICISFVLSLLYIYLT